MCNENVIEDESHFLFNCKLYDEERKVLFTEVQRYDARFTHKSRDGKLTSLMSAEVIKLTAKFLYTCYFKRRHMLYN